MVRHRLPADAGDSAEDRPRPSALLIIDMVSTWDFPDAEPLLQGAEDVAPAIAALKARCRAAGLPVIYANDNHGDWRSDFRGLIQRSVAPQARGARVTRLVEPTADDYAVLKPKHSAFYAAPLEVLLRHLGVRRLILAGVSSDQCVMATAAEARMRDLDVAVARDGVASQTVERNRAALRLFEDVMKLEVSDGHDLSLG